MKVMRIRHDTNDEEVFKTRYAATLTAAKEVVRERVTKPLRDCVIVEQVEVDTSQAGIINLLNGAATTSPALRTWGITVRGGLVEEPAT